MKKFFKGVMEWKTAVCFLYTGCMVIYLVLSLLLDNREATVAYLWTLLLACAAGALIQGVCFSDWIFKKMRHTRRSLLFVALYLPVLSLVAWKANWFPADEAGAWLVFLAAFFATYIVMTVGFDIYFRIAGRKYDGLLGQYRREKEKKQKE